MQLVAWTCRRWLEDTSLLDSTGWTRSSCGSSLPFSGGKLEYDEVKKALRRQYWDFSKTGPSATSTTAQVRAAYQTTVEGQGQRDLE